MNILDEGWGHKRSFEEKRPVDKYGNPLPWFTYPAIEYLRQLNLKNLSVLEWGTGNSTLFFAQNCREILVIEHNKEWYDLISGSLPANAEALLIPEEDYAAWPMEKKKKFDIIVVDGIKRGDCINTALEVITENGLLIFDNSERNPELCEHIRNHNFIQVDFHGLGPINPYAWTTSFFFSRLWNMRPLSIQPVKPVNFDI